MSNKPQFLLKRGTNRVFPYTDDLAKRPDMLECDKKGRLINSESGESDQVISRLHDRIRDLEIQLQQKDGTIKLLRHIMKANGLDPNATHDESAAPAEEEEELPEDETPADTSEPEAGNDNPDDPAVATVEEVVEAIGKLSKPDFNKSGAPKVEALEKILDKDVTSEIRDQAWEIAQKA